MEESLIREIINLAHDIYSSYSEPKLFKWDIVRKNRKKRVVRKLDELEKKITDTFQDCSLIDYQAVVDYFCYIGLSYPPKGKYRHTDMIKSKELEEEFAASFSFDLNHKDKTYKCQAIVGFNKEVHEGLNIIYTCKDKDATTLQFVDEKVFGFMIKYSNGLSPEIHNYDIDKEGDIIRNEFSKALLVDILEFILEKIDFYKERIWTI